MGSRRAWFGNLPLWSHLLRDSYSVARANAVAVDLGLDQDRALHRPGAPNATATLEVTTWAGPAAGDRTPERWRSARAAMHAAIRARLRYGFPVVLCEDDALDRTLEAGAGLSYQTSTQHAFEIGDVLYLVRETQDTDRAALHWFGWGTVAAIAEANLVTFEADPTTDDYSPEPGDRILRVSSLWSPLYCPGIREIARAKVGDVYSPAIVWPFLGLPDDEVHAGGATTGDRP